MSPPTRRYQFSITFDVESDHPAYGDPEWAADAAHGALSNEYGLTVTYSDVAEIPLVRQSREAQRPPT